MISKDTAVKYGGDLLFAGSMVTALLAGRAGLVVALLIAAAAGYATGLHDEHQNRRLGKLADMAADARAAVGRPERGES